MERDGSLRLSQESTTCPCPDPNQSNVPVYTSCRSIPLFCSEDLQVVSFPQISPPNPVRTFVTPIRAACTILVWSPE